MKTVPSLICSIAVAAVAAAALLGSMLPAQAVTACDAVIISGHRGMNYPTASTNENTLRAFDEAIAAGATVIETDTYLLSDGATMVINHDATWKRTISASTLYGVPPYVIETSVEQVARLRTKGGQPVPYLSDAIQWAADHNVTMYVEVKSTPTAAAVATIKAHIEAMNAPVAFYAAALANIRPLREAGLRVGTKYKSSWDAARYKKQGVEVVFATPDQMTSTLATNLVALNILPSTTAITEKDYRAALDDGFLQLNASYPANLRDWLAFQCSA